MVTDPDFRDSCGVTALHAILKNGSDLRHLRTEVDRGSRGGTPDAQGRTAIDMLPCKRDLAWQRLADRLEGGG